MCIRDSVWKELKFIEEVVHFNQDLYSRLMTLYKVVITDNAANGYLSKELTMGAGELYEFKKNLEYIVKTLNGRCHSGLLKMDLGFKEHFLNQNAPLNCGVSL